jgi:hypothetical protein
VCSLPCLMCSNPLGVAARAYVRALHATAVCFLSLHLLLKHMYASALLRRGFDQVGGSFYLLLTGCTLYPCLGLIDVVWLVCHVLCWCVCNFNNLTGCTSTQNGCGGMRATGKVHVWQEHSKDAWQLPLVPKGPVSIALLCPDKKQPMFVT